MPPEGRRKKKFEREMRRVQNRNFFAALVLIIAAVATIFLIQWILVTTKPKVFVSINRVDHSGTREIPFSEKSCLDLKQSFDNYLTCTTLEIQELDADNSRIKLDPNISSRDVLIVYLNGHLVGKSDANGSEVSWIGPEADRIDRKLSEVLESADASQAKVKIILLDAGRYSWSPGYPGREPNQFQTALIEKMAANEWGLGENFWVITSHSDYEISNVSTPLQRSLFASAVAETLKTLAIDKADELLVPDLFNEIRIRTQSYSRNFNNKSLQNPVLIRAGVGLVETNDPPSEPAEEDLLRFSWIEQATPDAAEASKPPPVKTYPLVDFARDSEKYSRWLFQPEHYAALPNQTLRSVERFLEFGDGSLDWPTRDREKIDQYTQQLASTSRAPAGAPTDFDQQRLTQKQKKVEKFRHALLELSVLIRLRDQIRFWDDNAYEAVPDLRPRLAQPLQLNDNDLISANTLLSSIDDWMKEWEDFRDENEDDLFRIVRAKLAKSEPLSPMQAELLGVLSQRYLKLIKPKTRNEVAETSESNKTEPAPGEIQITLDIDFKGRFNPNNQPTGSNPNAGYEEVVQNLIAEIGNFRNVGAASDSDTSLRYRLAAAGSEFVNPIEGTVPDIAWKNIAPTIKIEAIAGNGMNRINPYEMIPIQFTIKTSAVDDLNLSISVTDGEEPEGLNFGFTPEFMKTDILSQLDPAGERFSKQKTIGVFFQYPQFDPTKVDRPFGFSITATDRNNTAISDKIDFKVKISDDPTYWLKTKRGLASMSSDDRQARLFHWDTKLINRDWKPLVMRTLANVKSDFEFSLQSNSMVSRSFIVKLFKIKQYPGGIDENLLRADRDDWEQFSNFSRWLAGQNLEPSDYFELIGQAKIEQLDPQETKPIPFQIPLPKNPEEKKPDPEASVQVEIERGALVVFYTLEKPDVPEWFQMIQFEPRDSANVAANLDRMKVKTGIENVFKNDIDKLATSLAPLPTEAPAENSAARLTIVSRSALNENRNVFETLKIEEVLAKGGGARFTPGGEPALLMLDVLGVPNFATYEINGSSIENTPLRKRLAGIRVVKAPEGWTHNPNSWSFASTTPSVAPFEWLAGDSNSVTDFFIWNEAKAAQPGGSNEWEVELFLPFKNDSTLSRKQDDFWYRWKDFKPTLFYPNDREHFFEISGKGLNAWSRITSHRLKISDPANKILEVGQGEQILGKWKFLAESLQIRPVIEANPKKSWTNIPDLKTVRIDVDVREIKPVVLPSQITLKLNKKPVKEIAEFLEKHANGSGRYRFSLHDILSEFDEPLKEEKSELEIEVQVSDFFGKQTSRSAMVTVAPEPVIPPPPKPVTLVVNLVLDEKPADVLQRDLKGNYIVDTIIDKTTIPLNRITAFKGGQVKITYDETLSILTIEGLLPGNYPLTVNALVKPTGEAMYTPGTASSKGKIKVVEGVAPVTLVFQ